jgi:hypothetical protein
MHKLALLLERRVSKLQIIITFFDHTKEDANSVLGEIKRQISVYEIQMYELLSRSAESGNMQSQYDLYIKHRDNDNNEEAIKVLRRSAAEGHSWAQCNLGLHYADQLDKPQESVMWLRAAALQGHPRAQFHLGVAYRRGFGVEMNWHAAMHWISRAAEAGLCEPALFLGHLYYHGADGVEQDFAKARLWFKWALSLEKMKHFDLARGEVFDEDITRSNERLLFYNRELDLDSDGCVRVSFNLSDRYPIRTKLTILVNGKNFVNE